MEFIDFTDQQITENASFLENNSLFRDFISEYIFLCDRPEGFKERLNKAFLSIDKDKTVRNIEQIKSTLIRNEPPIFSTLGEIRIPPVIIFAGPIGWDGHGIIVKDKAFIFLNMTRFNSIMDMPGYETNTHLIHEVIHGIHYHYSPEFYFKNCNSPKAKYLNKIIAEGLATYLSGEITDEGPEKTLTFGVLEKNLYEEWIKRCEVLKKDFRESMEKCFSTGEENEELWSRLFFVPDLEPDCLARGRYGYYYGMEIVRNIRKEVNCKALLTMRAKDIHSYIKDYFEADHK